MSTALQTLIDGQLKPEVVDIDIRGVYPRDFLSRAGAIGLYVSEECSGQLGQVLHSAATVARTCGSTGFLVWCQNASAWYLANTENESLRERYFPDVRAGRRLAGTALSNPVKHYAGIEALKLRGRRVTGGYEVTGTLPWVSNLGPDHAFAFVFAGDEGAAMGYLTADRAGLSRLRSATFAALEGTATFAVRFDKVFVADSEIVSPDARRFLLSVQAGFVLLQIGLGLGLIEGALDDIEAADRTHEASNRHLPDRLETLVPAFTTLRDRSQHLAKEPLNPSPDYLRSVLELRLGTAELVLKAAQSAALHAGAMGFLVHASPQRRMREAHFYSILTPSVRHLCQALHQRHISNHTPSHV